MASVEEIMYTTPLQEVRENLYPKKTFKPTYAPSQILLGAKNPDLSGPVVSIEFATSKRVSVIGGTGAGKTNLLHLIASQLMKAKKFAVAFLCDYKNEVAKTLPFPLQSRLRDRLPPGVSPMGFPVRSYLPYVTKVCAESLQEGPQPKVDGYLQYPLNQMSPKDILTLAGINQRASERVEAKMDIFYRRAGRDLMALKEFLIEEEDEEDPSFKLTTGERRDILFAISQLMEIGLVGDKHVVDITKDLDEGKIVSIDFEKFDEMKSTYLQAVCAVETRHLLNYPKPTVLIYDEAHTVAPKGAYSSSKEAIQFLINVGRARGKSTIIASQAITNPSRQKSPTLDPTLLKQNEYFLFSYRTTRADIDFISQLIAITPMERYYIKELQAHPAGLKTGQWALLDMTKPEGRRLSVFYPYINPCKILEERRIY